MLKHLGQEKGSRLSITQLQPDVLNLYDIEKCKNKCPSIQDGGCRQTSICKNPKRLAAHTTRSTRAEDRNLYLLFVPRSGLLVQLRELSWGRRMGEHKRGSEVKSAGSESAGTRLGAETGWEKVSQSEDRQADRLEGYIWPLVTMPRQLWKLLKSTSQ